MPQFDFYSFFEQVFLVLFIFLIFYFLFLKFYLVVFSKNLKIRLKFRNQIESKKFGKEISKLNTFLFFD